jgi:cytoskeletal protein RodZ
MAVSNRTPLRFSLLTVIIWLGVAAGVIFLLWQVITGISGNNLPVSTATPDLTQVFQTSDASLTNRQTSTATSPTQTFTSSPTARLTQIPSTPLPSPMTTITPGGITQTSLPEVNCDQAAAGNPIDITIPDDTLISPGQSFIKTWKLVNIGSCTWTTLYSASFFYGDRMGAPETVPLQRTILPAQSVEISVEMVAPQAAGTYQGNWKLSNPSGSLFGIGPNGDSPFWVRIIVPENPSATTTVTQAVTATSLPTVTPTVTATATQAITATSTPTFIPTSTATTTPPVQASAKLLPVPGDAIDLDALTINSGGEDLEYQADANQYHWLSPQAGAMIGVYSYHEPSLPDCQSAGMSSAPIAVESLSVGTYLCFATQEGRFGRTLLEAVNSDDFTLTLDMLTWQLLP